MENIFIIFIAVFIGLHIFMFVVSLLFDSYSDWLLRKKETYSLGGPVRNIKYYDKYGNVIYEKKTNRKRKVKKKKVDAKETKSKRTLVLSIDTNPEALLENDLNEDLYYL